jgi:hypothetical protein
MSLFSGENPASCDPYSPDNLDLNLTALKLQVQEGLRDEGSLDAYRLLLLVVMLSDDRVTRPPVLHASHIRSLEELSAAKGRPRASEADQILATVPSLVRILNSMAQSMEGWLGGKQASSTPPPPVVHSQTPSLSVKHRSGMSKQLRCSVAVFRNWPLKLASLQSGAAGDDAFYEDEQSLGILRTPDSRRTLRTPEVSAGRREGGVGCPPFLCSSNPSPLPFPPSGRFPLPLSSGSRPLT